jgi:diguanylate cyclase (GGDEF)-like protein
MQDELYVGQISLQFIPSGGSNFCANQQRDPFERVLSNLIENPLQQPLVLMLLDLDGFKGINDNYGHDAGDEVSVQVCQRFKSNIRRADIVGRLGGDEFVIVLPKCEPIHVERTIAGKIIKAIQEPIELKTKQTVSIGVSINAV